MNDAYVDLDTRIQAFRDSDAQREDLLAGLVARLRNLERSHKELAHDYDNERNSRRHWQSQCEQIERQLTTSRHAAEVNTFVQVLIDGDASYFHESLISDGEKGGERAAAELHGQIRKHIQSLFPGSDLPIMLHMYANLGGLSGLYTRSGIITSPAQLFVFARGFNSSQDMFNLVDVGTGKEGADHKVREMLRIFMSNQNCKHIIFGGLHDNGYLNVLKPWTHDPEKKQRITLLETLPAQPGFKLLGYPIITVGSVFKAEQPKATTAPAAVEPSSSSLPSRLSSPVFATSTTAGASNGSWSTKAATNGKGVVDVSSAKPKPAKYILKNADEERLDERLPIVPSSAFESLKKKREGGNACNDLYLGGQCSSEYTCGYKHNLKLNAAELNALKNLARNLSCPNLSYCEDFKCYKGHVCVHDIRGSCQKDECYFAEVHGIDPKPAYKVYEDGRHEVL